MPAITVNNLPLDPFQVFMPSATCEQWK